MGCERVFSSKQAKHRKQSEPASKQSEQQVCKQNNASRASMQASKQACQQSKQATQATQAKQAKQAPEASKAGTASHAKKRNAKQSNAREAAQECCKSAKVWYRHAYAHSCAMKCLATHPKTCQNSPNIRNKYESPVRPTCPVRRNTRIKPLCGETLALT
jgi:hypothetical protein